MRKPIIFSAILLLGALAFAGQAAAYELNLWGASAQFQLYTQSANNFLTNAPNDCPAANIVQTSNGSSLSITTGTGCTGTNGSTVTLRVSSKASYDGVLALQGEAWSGDKTNASEGTTYFCNPGTAVDPNASNVGIYPASCNPGVAGDSCDYYYRVMYKDTTGALGCKRVHLALADADPASLNENSPLRYFPNGVSYPAGFNHYNPLVVPFGFYVNTDVTESVCSGGVNDGQDCNQSDTTATCTSGTNCDCPGGTCEAPAQLKNITRLQAFQIYTLQVSNWSDFGGGYVNIPITVCMRDAGSGSLATMDYGLFRSNGKFIDPTVGLPTTTLPGIIWNDGTGAEVSCVNANPGAFGFADADYALSMDPLWTALGKAEPATYATTYPLKLDGVAPSRRSIRNGVYDNFWSIEWVLENPNNPDYTSGIASHAMVTNSNSNGLIDQVSNPTIISATDRKDFWASMCEMKYMKLDPNTSQPSYKYYPEYAVGVTWSDSRSAVQTLGSCEQTP
jgi:ABC-type phosphate transport system substrate-binding protein